VTSGPCTTAPRADFWQAEHDNAELRLQSEGITLQHFDVTGGRRSEAKLDASLVNRVSECEQKLKAHQEAILRFRAYKSLFDMIHPEELVELNVDDVLYFNVRGADKAEVD